MRSALVLLGTAPVMGVGQNFVVADFEIAEKLVESALGWVQEGGVLEVKDDKLSLIDF